MMLQKMLYAVLRQILFYVTAGATDAVGLANLMVLNAYQNSKTFSSNLKQHQ